MVLIAAALPGTAAADGGCPGADACLVVTVTGTVQESTVVTGDDLDSWHDMTDPPYRTHSTGGTQNEPRPHEATSIPAILAHLPTPIPVGSVHFVTGRAFDGAPATRLTEGQLGSDGYQGGVAPGFSADADGSLVRFTRPMRSDDDLNYTDVWTTREDGQALLVVHTSGSILQPQIVPTVTSTTVGAAVGFSVDYDGATPTGAQYTWTFQDGTTSASSSPDHVWSTSGTYSVTLDVTAGDGSEGTASPVQIQVGPEPKPSTGPSPGTGTGGAHHPVTAPAHGAGSSTNASPGPSTAAGGTGGTSSTGGTGQQHGHSPTRRPGRKHGDRPAPVTGDQVEGLLLVSDRNPAAESSPSSKRPSAISARAVPTETWDRRVLWCLVPLGLLVLGALGQSRWWWRRRPVPPWRITG